MDQKQSQGRLYYDGYHLPATMPTLPPGPKSVIPFRYLRTLQRDPIPFFARVASEYGDAAQFFVGPQQIFLFNHPDLIRELLVTQHRSFHKSRVLQRSKIIFGEGLLTSEEELHRRQRRLVQPAFHRERIGHYAEVMINRAAKLRETWRDGEVLDVHHEMMGLTLSVVAKTLFDADVDEEADEIGVALTSLVDLFPTLMNPLSNLLRRLPLPQTVRFRRSIRRLDKTVYAIIDERRRSGEDRGDLLSMLLLAVDEEGDGGRMTDRQLRDEAMTLFLAGHETTANALAWTWYLLARNPVVLGELHGELDSVLGDRIPMPEDYPRLPYAEMVVSESMRMFPPAWAVSRLAIEDAMIGDWLVPRGAVAVAAQAVMHRDARWWPAPDRFDPLRFTPEAKMSRPKLAYFPFGAGPRVCIGEGFAWMEAVLIVATLAQRWRLELVSNDVTPQASITLRPKGGIRMRLHRR
ncbi:MAG TPA: cytochrome P450 [Thermoanaerobaculia bacterium]|nr:cytochrome P450 [Thermoanaerobaculia bacterium]